MSGPLAESLPSSVSRRMRRRSESSARMLSRSAGQWAGRPLVLDESLFRDVLLREKRRADRFEQPFVLALISLKGDRSSDTLTWSMVIEALTSVKRDTDVLGWYGRESALAMILPGIECDDPQFVREVESRIQIALAR